MSIIISDAECVRSNTANKKNLLLPKSRMNDQAPIGTSFGGRGTISSKKYEEHAKKSAFYSSKASWQ